jgi:hypothetical protein
LSFVFFDTLFPPVSEDGKDLGFVAVSLYPGGTFNNEEGPTQTHFFAWPSQRDDLVAFCLHNTEKDIYTVPALFGTRSSRKAANIVHQWAAYADADDLDLTKVKTEPTMVVETSEGRHHLYWVTNVDDPTRLVAISRGIAEVHKADGCDPGGWDAGQLLRVPGTSNNKRQRWQIPQPKMGPTYDVDALAKIYPPFEKSERPVEGDAMPPKTTWYYTAQSIRESAEAFRSSPEIYELYAQDLRPDQDRSRMLWKLLSLLSRLSVSRLTAMHIAWDAKCNKYKIEGRPEEHLWNQLCKAYQDPENQPIKSSFANPEFRSAVDKSDENPENKLLAFAESVAILNPEERDRVPEDTFIDRYASWASTRTDAPEIYHRAMAAMILSAIFGEFGKCPTKFETNLTLWFFILGPTTRARKTTAMMLGIDLIDDLMNDMFQYLLGSDVTSEALSAILPQRNGRTSVFYRDEAHGLLFEQSQKRYLAGVREHMTELFSGRVRTSLRVSNLKEVEERDMTVIRTNFIMYLCGTLDQVAANLTLEDYQSGHLARFLIAEADPPPITREGMYTSQFDGQTLEEDAVRQGLINDMAAARTFWLQVTAPGDPVIIPFAPDAWDRLQDAKYVLYKTAEDHELREVLLPTTARMGDSMMKLAVLIAMGEREKVVKLRHLFKAAELAEEWYRCTVKVAGKILHSEWAARQNEILTAIQTRRDGLTEQDIYSRFRSKAQEKDIESDLRVLCKAKLIHRTEERGRVRYIPLSRAA